MQTGPNQQPPDEERNSLPSREGDAGRSPDPAELGLPETESALEELLSADDGQVDQQPAPKTPRNPRAKRRTIELLGQRRKKILVDQKLAKRYSKIRGLFSSKPSSTKPSIHITPEDIDALIAKDPEIQALKAEMAIPVEERRKRIQRAMLDKGAPPLEKRIHELQQKIQYQEDKVLIPLLRQHRVAVGKLATLYTAIETVERPISMADLKAKISARIKYLVDAEMRQRFEREINKIRAEYGYDWDRKYIKSNTDTTHAHNQEREQQV